MQAVYFLRPTRENVARLRRELRSPRFMEYNLCELPLSASPISEAACRGMEGSQLNFKFFSAVDAGNPGSDKSQSA